MKDVIGKPGTVQARWVDWLLVIVGVGLAVGSLYYTGVVGREEGLADDDGYKVWQLLVMLQFLVWAGIAVLNTRNLRDIRTRGDVDRKPWLFLAAVYGGMLLIFAPALTMGLIASEDSALACPVILLVVIGGLAVLPALLSLHRVRAVAKQDALWKAQESNPGDDPQAPDPTGDPSPSASAKAVLDNEQAPSPQSDLLMRRLRRRVQPAVASVGVVIGLALIVDGQIASARVSLDVESGPPLIVLYGSFFTGVLFAIYVWVDAALDWRSRSCIDDLVGPSDPTDWAEFQKTEARRTALESAFGLGRSTRESFEGLVAVASPLIGALTAFYIA